MGKMFEELELNLKGQYDKSIKEHIAYPVYTDNYEDALRAIFLDILRKSDLQNERSKRDFSDIARESENIIAFLGKRGSGKTTAMEEFSRIMKSLKDKKELLWWLEHCIPEEHIRDRLKQENFFFHVFPRIDVSMLENKEDLFELIMSNLYALFKERDERNYCFQEQYKLQDEIINCFNRILTGYYALQDSREEEYIDSYIARVQHVSHSLNWQKEIDDLIEKMFKAESDSGLRYYLVIALDDLDLNIEHGFEMLKQLQKYFSGPHFIITFSADYEQLNEVCWSHFVKAFSYEKSHVIEQEMTERCRVLGKDYIEKALPLSKRVYLPNLNHEMRNILVMNNAKDKGETIKQYVMHQLANKMRIYYDISGKKMHFAEPENIRGLVNYHHLLEELYPIDFVKWKTLVQGDEEGQIYMEQYDQNHERVNMDIINRLANRILSVDQKREFYQWLQIRLERRAESACVFMQSLTDDDSSEEEEWSEMDYLLGRDQDVEKKHFQDDPGQGYSYGALLQGIYQYGREKPDNKAYVKCILASLTSEMVREKVCYSKNPNPAKREEAKQILLTLGGTPFGNDWIGEMVPGKRLDQYHLQNQGFQEMTMGAGMTRNLCEIPENVFDSVNRKKTERIKSMLTKMEKIVKDAQLIPSLEWMFLHFDWSGKRNRHIFPVRFEIVLSDTQVEKDLTEKYVLQMSFINVTVRAGLFEMIPKTLDFSMYLSSLHEMLSVLLAEALLSMFGNLNVVEKGFAEDTIKSWFENMSMFSKRDIRPIFPFYQVDYSYNIMKRTRRELLQGNPTTCGRSEWLDYVKKMYDKLIENMKKEEEDYQELGITLDYSKRFAEFPMIKQIREETTEMSFNPVILDLVKTIFCGDQRSSAVSDIYAEEE